MKRKPDSISIVIPNPCNENWDNMTTVEKGRFCSNCNKTVFDFSLMTENEFLRFIKDRKTLPCGRFSVSQLDRPLFFNNQEVRKPRVFLKKIAALFLALISFRNAQANTKTVLQTIQCLQSKKCIELQPADTAFIVTGVVKDSEGKLIQGAYVHVSAVIFTFTDENGKFKLELGKADNKSHLLYFEYGDMVTVVRNFHPAMGNTSYDIVLQGKMEDHTLMGISIILPSDIDFSPLEFEKNKSKLSSKGKKLLKEVASTLKGSPDLKLKLIGYPPVCDKYPKLRFERFSNVSYYLEHTFGISRDRITGELQTGGGDMDEIIIDLTY